MGSSGEGSQVKALFDIYDKDALTLVRPISF
jgi:hypothetical protein